MRGFDRDGLASVKYWKRPVEGTRSPWGPVQTSERIASGIYTVGTAGHGGVWLSPARRASRWAVGPRKGVGPTRKGPGSSRAWFEEDCEWAFVVLAFPTEFRPFFVKCAFSTLRAYFPAALETWAGPVRATAERIARTAD